MQRKRYLSANRQIAGGYTTPLVMPPFITRSQSFVGWSYLLTAAPPFRHANKHNRPHVSPLVEPVPPQGTPKP